MDGNISVMPVLGIDVGGSKTVCLLADNEGRLIAESRDEGANLQGAGELALEKVLHSVMEAALEGTGLIPSAICLGIAGVDRDFDQASVRSIMSRIGYRARILVVNDALIAIDSGLVIGDAARTARTKAVGKFIQGLSHGYLGLYFDSAAVIDERSTAEELRTPRFVGYPHV